MVGPPGIEAHLAQMNEAGAVGSVTERAHANLDLRFVEVDGSWQQAGPLRFRAVEVVHVPYLRCFGYLFDRGTGDGGAGGGRRSGPGHRLFGGHHAVRRPQRAGPGVRGPGGRVQRAAHARRGSDPHMDEESVRALQAAHPGTQLILTHLGEQVDTASLTGVTIPDDFERLMV